MTTRNAVLDALTDLVRGAVPGATVSRNAVLPDRMPAGGLAAVRDGDPGEPDVVLSPLSYAWTHRAVLEAVVSGSDPVQAAADLDAILVAIGEALAADRTLGGLCDWAQPSAPVIDAVPMEGAASLLGATVTVTLTYTTSDPLA